MRPGSWPDTPVRSVAARAIVGGIPVDIDSVSLTAEMSSDLPLVGGGQLAVTDGSVDWPQQALAAVKAPQPFMPASFPPAIGTPLNIEVGDGMGQWFRLVTGRIDSNSGSLTSGVVQSRLVDNVDRLSVPIWHDALINKQPHPHEDRYRQIGLTGTFISDFCARAAGFHATPPVNPANSTLLSVPFMGSAWPEVGVVESCERISDPVLAPAWIKTAYGLAPSDVDAVYTATGGSGSSAPVLTACLGPQPAGSVQIKCYLLNSDGWGVSLAHSEVSDNVRVGVKTPAGDITLGLLPRNGNMRAAVKVTISGSTATLVLRLADGTEATYTNTDAVFTGWVFSQCQLIGAGCMGGLMVEGNPASPWATMAAPATAIFRVGPTPFLFAMPALKGQTALSLLTEQAAAECASVWIDAYGVLRWVGRGLLEADPPVVTKSTALTVDDIPWSIDLRSVYSRVTLPHSAPAIWFSSEYTIRLYQAEVTSMYLGQILEQWYEAPEGTDWIVPDKVFQNSSSLETYAQLARGSRFGGVVEDDSSETAGGSGAIATSSTWSSNKVLWRQECTALDAGKVWVNKIADKPTMPRSMRGTGLPLIRGKALVTWSELSETFSTGANAATSVANYDHACAWHVQNDIRRTELKDFLCAALANPRPEFSVSIDPDPRLELGDKVTIQDPYRTGLTLDIVVTGISQSYGADVPSMTLSGRLTRVEQTWTLANPVAAWQTFLANWATTVGSI